MHKQRIAILLIAAVGMAATFLPWLTIGGAPVPSPGVDRWLALGLFAAAGLVALAGNKRRSCQGAGFIAFAVPAILASAVGIYHLVQLAFRPSVAAGQINLFALTSPAWGLYLVAATGFALVITALMLQNPRSRPAAEMVRTTV